MVADTSKGSPRVRLTREQAAERLGLTLPGFQSVEKTHCPPRHLDRAGCVFYYPEDIDVLKDRPHRAKGRRPRGRYLPREDSKRVGKQAARVFEMFRDRVDHRTIVIECKVTPMYVCKLWKYWVTTPQDANKARAEYEADREYRYTQNQEYRIEIERIRAQATIDAAREAAKESRARAYEKPKP